MDGGDLAVAGISLSLWKLQTSFSMKHLLLAAALFGCLTSAAETPWKPAGDRIKTRWAAEVDPAAPLPEYPRPTLVRSRWRNLNGLWNYSLTPAGAAAPGEAQGGFWCPSRSNRRCRACSAA